MKVSAAAAPSSMDTINIENPKSQVDVLEKKGATIVDQGVNYYSTNAMTFSTLAPNQSHDIGVYKHNLNEDTNHTYLIN